jgi:Uncharacterized conserved protein
MTQMHHRTTTLERSFPVKPEAVFQAWADLEKRSLWNSPSDEVKIKYAEDDFSIGGKDVSLCLVGDYVAAEVIGIYHDIAPNRHIVYTEVISSEGAMQGMSLVSVTFTPSGAGTDMTVTLQTTAVSGADFLKDVEEGWTASMGMMEKLLVGYY